MRQSRFRVIWVGMLAAMLLGGCASNSELRVVREEAKNAQNTANQALEVAHSAQRTAQDADARSRDTQEMVNRSFKKSMRK